MIRVFLADDHALLREGVRRVLCECGDICVAGEAATGDEVLQRAEQESWDVLLLDLSLPGPSGLDLVRRLLAVRPRLRILILTMHPEDQHALHLLHAGAAGFLTKSSAAAAMLVGAVRTVAAGRRFVSPALTELLLCNQLDPARLPHESLSPRQYEILVLLGRCLTPKEIAAQLLLSANTVSSHIHEIKQRLSLQSLSALVRYAIDNGLA